MTVRDHAAIAQMVEMIAFEGVSINEAATRVATEVTGCAWLNVEALRRRFTRKYQKKFKNRVIRISEADDGNLFYAVYDEDIHALLVSKGLWKSFRPVREIRTKMRQPVSTLLIARLLGADIGPSSTNDFSLSTLSAVSSERRELAPYMEYGVFVPCDRQ